jgi:hypothetical protein
MTHDGLTGLKQKLIGIFREESSEWNSRKHSAPEPDDDNDYWWECKAKWSMCQDAVRLIRNCDETGTLEEYGKRLRNSFAENQWGTMENWGAGPQWQAKTLVFDRLNGALADAVGSAHGLNG